jgi:hypothetical protein
MTTRARVADDFAVIRARMEELRRERGAGEEQSPKPNLSDWGLRIVNNPRTPASVQRLLLKHFSSTIFAPEISSAYRLPLANLVYNIKRMVWLTAQAVPA